MMSCSPTVLQAWCAPSPRACGERVGVRGNKPSLSIAPLTPTLSPQARGEGVHRGCCADNATYPQQRLDQLQLAFSDAIRRSPDVAGVPIRRVPALDARLARADSRGRNI